MERRILEEEAH